MRLIAGKYTSLILMLVTTALWLSSVQSIDDDHTRQQSSGRLAASLDQRQRIVIVTPASYDTEEDIRLIDPSFGRRRPVELTAPVELRQSGQELAAADANRRDVSELSLAGDERPLADPQYRPPPGSSRDRGSRPGPAPVAAAGDRRDRDLIRCGQVDVDPRGALCCDGIVYRRNPGADARCCGRVAYDGDYYACCGPIGRHVIIRRVPVMPACCSDRATEECPRVQPGGYESDSTGLGSVCCQPASGGGGWRCCLRGESCCDGSRTIDVPGFRPACCDADAEKAAQCCASTFESIRLLPECCDNDRLRPVCCKRPDGTNRCCPATYGYCCGHPERTTPVTNRPVGRQVLTTAAPGRRPAVLPSLYTTHQPIYYPDNDQYLADRPDEPRRREPSQQQQQQPRSYQTNAPNGRQEDRYPTERVDVPLVTGSSNASCCQIPSPTCCLQKASRSSGTGSRGSSVLVAACCRPVCCRPTSFNAVCCQRQRYAWQSSKTTPAAIGSQQNASTCAAGEDESLSNDQPLANATWTPTTASHHHMPPVSQSTISDGNQTSQHRQRQQPPPRQSCCAKRHNTTAIEVCCRDGYLSVGKLPVCCVAVDQDSVATNDGSTHSVLDEKQRELKGHLPMRRGGVSRSRRKPIKRRFPSTVSDVTASSKDHTLTTSIAYINTSCDAKNINYNESEYICCEGSPRRRIGMSSACCGHVAYDEYLYKCCNGLVRMSCSADYQPKRSAWGVLV